MLSPRRIVELFHLAFLRALVAKGEDKQRFALKGGCNLRFFFESVRYSEDIDLDVAVVARATLKNKIDRLLASPALLAPLKSQGIELVDASAPKQTDTTQRWKVGLRAAGVSAEVRTKIEFSRRGPIAGAVFEAVKRVVIAPYAMPPFLATHYGVARAVTQKIEALAGRREAQARDVFDLNLLLARPDAPRRATLTKDERARVDVAIERAMSLSFDDYQGQVVAYLHPDHGDVFGGRAAWDAMQGAVVERLEALR